MRLFIMALTALTLFVAYAPLAQATFVADDNRYLAAATQPLAWGARPFTVAAWQLLPQTPLAHHAANLVLHLIASALLWRVLTLLLVHDDVALLVAALFAVWPTTVETVAYATALADLLVTISILAAVLIAWQASSALRAVIGAGAVLALGLGAKEYAITGLAIVPLVCSLRRRSLLAVWALGLMVTLVAAWPYRFAGSSLALHVSAGRWYATTAAAVARELRLWVWPDGLTIEVDVTNWPANRSLWAMAGVVSVAAIAALRTIDRRAFVGAAWVVSAVAWRFLDQAPRNLLNDHQMYLSGIGLAIIAAAVLHRIWPTALVGACA